MSEIKKGFTNISEHARRILGISRDEYALCSYAQYRSADSRQKIAGWCCDEKNEVAEFVGITRMGLYRMIQKLEEMGLIETGAFGSIRATPKWIDTECACKQSLHDEAEGVNKVYAGRKQSLQNSPEDVNKVYETNKVLSKNISKSKVEDVDVPAALQTPAFLEQWKTLCSMPKWKKKNSAAAAAALRQLARFDPEFAALQVECAIAGNWQGVVFPDTATKYEEWKRKKGQPGTTTTTTITSAGRPAIRAGS